MFMKETLSRDQKEEVLKMCNTCLLVIVPAHHLGESVGVTGCRSDEPSLQSEYSSVFLVKLRWW